MPPRGAAGRTAGVKPSAALLRAAPPPPPSAGGPVGLYVNSAAAAEALLGAITTIADVDEVLREAGIARYQLRRLELDDEISAALDTRRDAVLSTPWRLHPAEGEAVRFVADELAPHIADALRGAWAAVPYGYSVVEVVYRQDRETGRVGLASIGERPMEWFRLHRDGRVVMTQTAGGAEIEVDTTYKHLVTRRNATWRNPQGDSLLSRLYWPWHFRHNAWRYWLTFLERFGMPILLGQGHDPKALTAALLNMGASAAVSVGPDEDVKAVTVGGSGEFDRAEAALARRIQKVILGQTLTTDVDGRGSYAAAKVHDGVRLDRRDADLRLITPTMQRVVDALWALNRFPGAPPRFLQTDSQGLQPERAERDAKLVSAGIVRLSEDYIVRAYDFEPGDVEVPQAPAPAAAARQPGAPAPARVRQAAAAFAGDDDDPRRFTRRQQEIEDLGDAALAAAERAGAVDQRSVRAVIRAAASPEDLAERLALLVPQLPGSAFEALLARALFAADVLGYAQEVDGGPVLPAIKEQSE